MFSLLKNPTFWCCTNRGLFWNYILRCSREPLWILTRCFISWRWLSWERHTIFWCFVLAKCKKNRSWMLWPRSFDVDLANLLGNACFLRQLRILLQEYPWVPTSTAKRSTVEQFSYGMHQWLTFVRLYSMPSFHIFITWTGQTSS